MHRLTLIAILIAAGCRTADHRLDALFSDLHRRGLFDGAVVVGRGTEIVWEKGFGYANVERQVPFKPDTPADGGSLAKTFTATLVLILEREGLIDLDAPAQRWLPELPYRDITLRHLLSHSSGLPVADYDYFDPFLPKDRLRTTEELLRVLAEQRPPLAFAPGTRYDYSSLGFDFAALAAARAAGKLLPALLTERFFAPLELSSAFLRPGRLSEFSGARTLGYRNGQVFDVFDMEAFHGGSNIYISARDLHRWNASFFSGEWPATTLQRARIGGNVSGLTLGSWYSSGGSYWYSGHLQGFHCEVFRDMRSRVSIVYVSNNTIEPWLQKAIVRAVNGRAHGPLMPPATDEVRSEERPALAGEWRMPDGRILAIQPAGTALFITRDGVAYRMVPVSSRAFYVPGLDYMIGFARGADGRFARIHISSNVEESWGVLTPAPPERN